MAPCPICQQPLPETPARYCPSCGADLAQSAPPSFEAGGPAPPPPPGGPTAVPWDDRDRLGWVTALVETTRLVLAAPGVFFRSMPTTGGIGSPLLYAVIVGWMGLIVASFYQAVFRSLMGSPLATLGDRPEVTALVGWVEGWAGFVMQVALGGMFVVIGVFVGAGIVHLFLLLLGGARNGFETTVRVVCFAQATSVVFLVPFCGQLVAGVWTLVLYVIGLAAAHRIGHGKAAAATLLPLVLLCCCCAGLAALFAGALASVIGHAAR
ncbi:MAG TPA: YIP1 family protein [Vicinamibacteria bacterium]|nr:YIP1 family protein [Vicinamibacteria bacterium]